MIARRPDLEPLLYDVLRQSFGDNSRKGVHLSSLISVRQTFWQRAVPLPTTDEEIGYWTAGRGHEDAVERLVALGHIVAMPENELRGVHLRPDFLSILGTVFPVGSLIELKTRRSNLPENDEEAQEEFSHYRAQMRGYMALYDVPEHFLIVLSLVEGKTGDRYSRSVPVYAVYQETMTAEDREATRQELQRRKAGLLRCFDLLTIVKLSTAADGTLGETGVLAQRALEAEFTLLPLCEAWLCGKRHKNLVMKAKCETCGQEFESEEFGPRKHVQSKKGAGHVMRPAVVEWTYEPRCKWYGNCRPWEIDPSRGGETVGNQGQQESASRPEENVVDLFGGPREGGAGEGASAPGVVADGVPVPDDPRPEPVA